MSAELGRLDRDESPVLVASIVLLPELAQAALKANEHGKVANWGLLRAHDGQGSGRLPLREAQRLISLGRGVSGRQARRLLAGGDGQYWKQDPGGHVRYFRPARVAERLGVAHVTRPRILDAARLRSGQASLKAALESTCYRNDKKGTPLTRRLVEELTGVPPSTQRRWENRYGNAELVAPCYVKRGDVGPMDGAAWLAGEGTWGFFWGKGRQLMRRHGDVSGAVITGSALGPQPAVRTGSSPGPGVLCRKRVGNERSGCTSRSQVLEERGRGPGRKRRLANSLPPGWPSTRRSTTACSAASAGAAGSCTRASPNRASRRTSFEREL